MSFISLWKRFLIRFTGRRIATRIQALRFRWLLRAGPKERETELLPALLAPGDVAVDVGANGADWTYALALQVGTAGRVYAFEADPYYAEATRETIRLLGLKNVDFQAYGLSDVDEEADLLTIDGRAQRVSGTGRVVREPGIEHAGRTVRVRLRRLDSIVQEYPRLREMKFMKCDVEGFELMVLRGASHLIAEARPSVLAEIGHGGFHGCGDRDVHRFFYARDYRGFVFEASTGFLVPDEEGPESTRGVHNCLFVPEEKIDVLVARLARPDTFNS